jgi:hypothetical protein
MKKYKKFIFPVVVVASAFSFFLLGNQPHSYDDCILKNIGKANSNSAANMVYKSCRNKFPVEYVYLSEEDFMGKK